MIALAAFLIGFVPMWLSYQGLRSDLRSVSSKMRPLRLRNDLATAAIMARRGHYEQARNLTSDFYTLLRAESESAEGSYSGEAVADILKQRDETITMLARSDPASADRLADIYYQLLDVTNKDQTSAQ